MGISFTQNPHFFTLPKFKTASYFPLKFVDVEPLSLSSAPNRIPDRSSSRSQKTPVFCRLFNLARSSMASSSWIERSGGKREGRWAPEPFVMNGVFFSGINTWNLFVLYFGASTLQNKAFSNQNKGQLGSRCGWKYMVQLQLVTDLYKWSYGGPYGQNW